MFTLPESLEKKVAQDISDLSQFLSAHDERSIEPEKYGIHFINDLFMIHPFCWCDEKDCPWCGTYQKRMEQFGAEKERSAPNFWHKPSNTKIWWYKSIGRDIELNKPLSIKEWKNIIEECKNSTVGL